MEHHELIGDGSQPYALPTLNIKHDCFKRIDASTLVNLIEGHYNHSVRSYTIVDCRYPYEYQGGHIVNSVNVHTASDLVNLFIDNQPATKSRGFQPQHHLQNQHRQPLKLNPSTQQDRDTIAEEDDENATNQSVSSSPPTTMDLSMSQDCPMFLHSLTSSSHQKPGPTTKNPASNPEHQISGITSSISSSSSSNNNNNNRHILIFHCEFSSERGPRLMRLLREKDRQLNKYPQLFHPELYLLEGGYRQFYKCFKEYCIPQAYKPMKSRNHRDELTKYRRRRKMAQPRRKENRTPDISFEA